MYKKTTQQTVHERSIIYMEVFHETSRMEFLDFLVDILISPRFSTPV